MEVGRGEVPVHTSKSANDHGGGSEEGPGARDSMAGTAAPGLLIRHLCHLRKGTLKFPGCPVVRTWCFHCHGPWFDSWLGNKDPASLACGRVNKRVGSGTHSLRYFSPFGWRIVMDICSVRTRKGGCLANGLPWCSAQSIPWQVPYFC